MPTATPGASRDAARGTKRTPGSGLDATFPSKPETAPLSVPADGTASDTAGDTGRNGARRGGRPRSLKARQAILDATLAVLRTDGLANLTIEGVAARAGVGKATIYRWWPSRIELALEAMEQLPELDVPDTGSFAEDLRGILTNLALLLAETPLQSLLGHLAAEGRAIEPEARDYMNRRMAGQYAIYERALERGELPPGSDPLLLATLAMGPVVSRAFFGPTPPDAAFIDLVVRTIVAGAPVAMGGRTGEAVPKPGRATRVRRPKRDS